MNTLQKTGCLFVLLLISAAASATVVQANYSVNANSSDPGLVIQTQDVSGNSFSHNVSMGSPFTFDLFKIWTDENSLDNSGFLNLGCGADCDSKPISVDFNFTLPGVGTSTVNGETQGVKILGGLFEDGQLTWNGPTDFAFGPLGDGLLRISLSDETFNKGAFGLNEGEGYGATVSATLSLISDATAVPAPGSLALFVLALIGVGIVARRRKRSIAPQLSA